jgi:uncharacterized membrane protein
MNISSVFYHLFYILLIFILLIIILYQKWNPSMLEIVMNRLYKKYRNQKWPLVSSAPYLLNFAYPDFNVKYYIMTFSKNTNILLTGTIPSDLNYWAITIYDTSGIVINHWNDSMFTDRYYKIMVNSHTNICAIVRYYNKSINQNELQLPTTLPHISVENKTLKEVDEKQITMNSKNLETFLYKYFSKLQKKYNFLNVDIHQFFLGNPNALQALYPNADAMYLMAFPKKTNVICIEGKLPPKIGYPHNIRFIGFMACNLSTTATDNSINFMDLQSSYKLWVAYSSEDAVQYGYNSKTDSILLWNKENQNPIIVYRQVQIKNTGLFIFKKATMNISGDVIESVMLDYYPKMTCY